MSQEFNLLVSDCPWKYNSRKATGTKFGGGSSAKYPQMTTEALCNLPVEGVVSSECIHFLWVTWPKLKDGLAVMGSWGFRYTTIGFIWIKLSKDGNPLAGPGCYTASNSEPCLIGIRGRYQEPEQYLVPSVILSQRGEHSKKPQEFYTRVERMYQNRTKLELFANKERDGWTTLGFGVDGKDITESLLAMQEDCLL